MNKPTVIIIHHSASPRSTKVGDIDRWHTARWPNFVSRRGFRVGYHYVIEQNGFVTQTRDHDEEGAHTLGMNKSSIGICLTGNFNDYEPTIEQINAVFKLIKQLRAEYGNLPTRPHRYYAKTDCFGKRLPDNYFDIVPTQLSFIELLKAWKSYLISLQSKTI
jgi:N-acetylmuramoyl-L-alanine amidase